MAALSFDKYEGAGNDFIVLEAPHPAALPVALAAALCDRHFGIGADGVLLLLPPERPEHAARMRVINADGSVPEMCGNGLRCLALHVARRKRPSRHELVIETDAGLRHCMFEQGKSVTQVTVDMGKVGYTGDITLDVAGRPWALALANAGNPHAVTFERVGPDDMDRWGRYLAQHPSFPHGTNVEFATLRPQGIDLVVWERGVGITLACGTGACATVAVACAKDMIPWNEPVAVTLPGGTLVVTMRQADQHALMRGPARHVFSGKIETRHLAAGLH